MSAGSVSIAVGIVGSGLIAGLFWGWMVAVGPGLAKVSDHVYVSSMQAINRAILNPVFILTFVGTAVVLVAAAVLEFRAGRTRRAWWLTVAAGTYLLAVLGITVGGNVPLNDTLEAFDLADGTEQAIAAAREGYEGPWNRLHAIRSVASVLVVTFASIAALQPVD